LYQQLNKEKI